MRGCPCRGSGLHPPPPLPSSPFTTSTLASPLFPRHTGPTSASQILNLLYPRPGVFFSWDVPKVCSPPPWGLYLNLTFLPWTNVCNLLVKKFSLYRPSWLYIFFLNSYTTWHTILFTCLPLLVTCELQEDTDWVVLPFVCYYLTTA